MYNSKVDLWSIGVIFYYFLTGKYIFGYSNAEKIYNTIKKIEPKLKLGKLFEHFSPKLKDLLTRLFQMEPEKRIEWKDLFEHSIFKQSI